MSIPMILLAIVSIAIFLGLAVLGEGGPAAFFSQAPFIATVVVTVLLVGISSFSQGNVNSGVREDRSNRWVFVAFTVISIFAGFVPAYCDRIGFWTIDGDVARWTGVVLFTVGGIVRIWPVFVLGNRFSGLVAIQEGHRLVTTGIYRFIRNPSYLGMLVTILGWALIFRSWIGILLGLSVLFPLVGRIRSEEAMLRSQFGEEYDRYCARTWRLVPGLY